MKSSRQEIPLRSNLIKTNLPVLLLLFLSLAGLTTSCSNSDLTELDLSAQPGSAQPHLAKAHTGEPILSWVESSGELATLKFSVLGADGWGEPTTVASGNNWFVNWADFPSVVAVNDTFWAAHWLAKRPGGTYAYDIAMSISDDGGKTWQASFSPHHDNTPTEHGFVSMFPFDDKLGAVWLDGRNMHGGEHDHNHAGSHDAGMTIRGAAISSAGEISDVHIIDGLVCGCCQTDATLVHGKPTVIYRNRSTQEIRDIYLSQFSEGGWSEGVPVARDNWQIEGCPVNGPAIASLKSKTAVSWLTLANNEPKVRLALSDDAANTFYSPIDVAINKPKGRVDVALLEDQSTIVSWIRSAANEAEFVVSRVTADGQISKPMVIAEISAERPSGFPQMIAHGEELIFAWSQFNESGSIVKTARLSTDVLTNK